MNRLYKLFFLILLLIYPLQAQPQSKIIEHSIKRGQTLFVVAKLYHSTSKDIQKENNLKKDEMLHIGQVIKVPTNTYFPTEEKIVSLDNHARSSYSNAKLVKHSIKKNETFFTIARKHHTTMDEILQENNIKANAMLHLGQILIVPTDTYDHKSKKIISQFKNHSIEKGETLFIIAKKYHSSVADIKAKNNLKKGEVLKLGRVLIVPKNTYFSNQITIKKVKKKEIKKKKKKKKVKKVKKKKRIKKKRIKKKPKIIKKKSVKKPQKKKIQVAKRIIYNRKSSSTLQKKITSIAKTKLGRRYVWGASGLRNTYDCSSFTKYVYNRNGISLPRTSIKQSRVGKHISKSQLKKGDLIFFDTSRRRKGYVNHVGIYLGNNHFIHASSSKRKVVVSKLEKFYLERYKGARRP
jgi:cell wall-associated NlpC family hydrolase